MKLLDNTKFEVAFTSIPPKDTHFLEILVEYLFKNRENFNSTSEPAPRTIEEAEDETYLKKIEYA